MSDSDSGRAFTPGRNQGRTSAQPTRRRAGRRLRVESPAEPGTRADVRPGDIPRLFAVLLGRRWLIADISGRLRRRVLAQVPGAAQTSDGRVLFPEVPMARGWARRLQDTCKRGHDLTDPRNVYVNKTSGARSCRRCAAMLQRTRRRAKHSKGARRA